MTGAPDDPARPLAHIVGGGVYQVPIVRRARAMGMRVLVTDAAADPPARAEADLFEQADTRDPAATLAHARAHGIDLITTDQTDVAVPTVAHVAERLGLRGIGVECALRFTDKARMRQALLPELRAHLPESHRFDGVDAALAFCRTRADDPPLLVKPVDSQGSRGVARLRADPAPALREAFAHSAAGAVVVERFVEGDEYSVESFVRDGQVELLSVTRKEAYPHNPCLEARHCYLGDIDPALEQRLVACNEAILQRLALPFGNSHAEFKVDASGAVYLMEAAARGAGAGISSHVIPFLTGFDPLEALLSLLSGRSYSPRVRSYRERSAIIRFFDFEPGKVAGVHVDHGAVRQALAFHLDVQAGDTIRRPRDSRDRRGYVIIGGESPEAVLEAERRALAAVRLDYAENQGGQARPDASNAG